MKSLIVVVGLLAMAVAQELDVTVKVQDEWPQNPDRNAGFIAMFAYSGIEEGSCIFTLPEVAVLFHVVNAHIIPGESTNPVERKYKIAPLANWEMENGTVTVLVICGRDRVFNASSVLFQCDPNDVEITGVASFPQNVLVKEASSNVHHKPGFTSKDVLTITLPFAVARFNITSADSRMTIERLSDGQTFVISGFPYGDNTDMKEVHFSLDYLVEEGAEPTQYWFSAGDVTAAVTERSEEEEVVEPVDPADPVEPAAPDVP